MEIMSDLVQFRKESVMGKDSNPALTTMKFTVS